MDLIWFYISGYVLLLLVAGYLLPFIYKKKTARACAWVGAIVTVLISTMLTLEEPPLLRMLVIVSLQLLSMKIVVAVESSSGDNRLTVTQWAAFALGWFGMRPLLFEKLPSSTLEFMPLILKGVSRIIIGFFILYISTIIERYPVVGIFFFPEVLLVIGMSLILHFGILNLSTAGWRMFGVNVSELFSSPYKSKSLREFWGKRWNLAFSEMTALVAYRPLRATIGAEKALILSFMLSGLLHEIAISFSVKAGYGLPMLYFTIHAIAMHLEANSPVVQRMIQHNVLSRLWVILLLVVPIPLLFHSWFIQDVLVPLRALLLQSVGFVNAL